MTDEYANWSVRGRAPADDEAGLREALAGDQPGKREAALALVDEAESGLADATVEGLVDTARSADDAKTRQFAVEVLGAAGRERETIAAALDDGPGLLQPGAAPVDGGTGPVGSHPGPDPRPQGHRKPKPNGRDEPQRDESATETRGDDS